MWIVILDTGHRTAYGPWQNKSQAQEFAESQIKTSEWEILPFYIQHLTRDYNLGEQVDS